MPKSCVAYNCKNRFVKGNGISFHMFPFAKEEVLQQWIVSLRLKGFCPGRHDFVCSEHFTPDSFYKNYVTRRILKENAVPSIFDFAEHLKKVYKPRKLPKECDLENSLPGGVIEENDNSSKICAKHLETEHNYHIRNSPKKLKYEELPKKKDAELNSLRKKMKVCKLKNSRKSKKIKSLSDIVRTLKSSNLINSKLAELLEQNYSDLSIDILKETVKCNKSYSDQLKSFALSLFFYSPKAYDYVRKTLMLSLPHPHTVKRWYNVTNFCPGFTAEALSAIN